MKKASNLYPTVLRYIHFAMQTVFLPMSDLMVNQYQRIKVNKKTPTKRNNQTKPKPDKNQPNNNQKNPSPPRKKNEKQQKSKPQESLVVLIFSMTLC